MYDKPLNWCDLLNLVMLIIRIVITARHVLQALLIIILYEQMRRNIIYKHKIFIKILNIGLKKIFNFNIKLILLFIFYLVPRFFKHFTTLFFP